MKLLIFLKKYVIMQRFSMRVGRPFIVCEMMKGRKQKSSTHRAELFYVAQEMHYRTRMSIPQSDAVVRTLSCEP